MMKSKSTIVIMKIVLVFLIILPLIIYVLLNMILKNKFNIYLTTNYLFFIIIETINLIIAIFFFVRKINLTKKFILFFCCYFILSMLIPVYHTGYTHAPTGPGSERMGITLKENHRNIYGLDITNLVKTSHSV